jgi:L-methionine (R)-S-oxide reductase
MFEMSDLSAATANLSKPELYRELAAQARSLLAGELDRIANAANFASLVFHGVPDLNWAGFYFYDGTELVVGPFQGKPACVRIALGKGVCGTAALSREAQLVPDVHAFPGHIACDSASNSEIVVPLIKNGQLLGVWDVDSPTLNRFDSEDLAGMTLLAAEFVAASGERSRVNFE